MNTAQTSYTSHAAPRLSLSEQRIRDITTKIDAFSRDIDAHQAELLRANEVLSQAYPAPERAAAVAQDIEAMHRRLKLTRQLRDAAIADRELHERQIRADRITAKRADWDRIGAGRTAKAHELVGATRLVAALMIEIDASADEALAVLDQPLEAGLTRSQVNLRRETLQGFVLELLSALLPPDMWDLPRPVFGHPRNVAEKLPDFIDSGRRAGLLAFDQALERVTQGRTFGAGQALGPGHAAAESHRRLQQRAAADDAANRIN